MATQGTHADPVARLRERAHEKSVVGKVHSMMGGGDEPLQEAALLAEAADALAALPPPADPPDAVDGQCPRCGERNGTHAAECRSQAAQAYGYLSRLFKHCAPQCEPLPDLMGVCTQIDNLIVGLRQVPADPPALVALVRQWQQDVENLGGAGPDEDITDQYQKQVWESEAKLLAYPLPAAPPVPASTPTYVEIDGDGDISIDFDRDRHNVCSLTIYQDGRVGYSAIVDGQSAHGIVNATEPMPAWVRAAICAPPVPETPQGERCIDYDEIAKAVHYYTGEDVDVLVARYRSESSPAPAVPPQEGR